MGRPYLALALCVLGPFTGKTRLPNVGLLLPVAQKPIDLDAMSAYTSACFRDNACIVTGVSTSP